MGLYNNLEPALQYIIEIHHIKIVNEISCFRESADPVFYFLQVSLYKDGLAHAMKNLVVDRRFQDANGRCNAAGYAIASYIKDRLAAPDPDDDELLDHHDEPTCVIS